ncbi:MAG TPA: Hsp33 family molecular chaperone HslO [Burkholderiaceae bacterium]|nr:Hsp33 family molecular chaperone HslO [Burkholderiaceae bacterium]
MSEIHKFLFDGLPVRGCLVRLTDAWQTILQRRANNENLGPYPQPVAELLGELTAAAVLMQSNIKFNGSLELQISGNAGSGPVKLAVAEVQSNLSLRATASIVGEVVAGSRLSALINQNQQGRCAVTLDPKDKFPGQQAYQGVVPLFDDDGKPLEHISSVLEHYMLQSEQLDTTLVLAANDAVAAGLLLQRLPVQGDGNLAGSMVSKANEAEIGQNEDYNRLSLFAKSLKPEELLGLSANDILHRLFWEENIIRYPANTPHAPQFACTCSRERVGRMLFNLGQDEIASILSERDNIEVGCEFCGNQERFDAIDAAQLFLPPSAGTPPEVH